jgi:hypothetical protein
LVYCTPTPSADQDNFANEARPRLGQGFGGHKAQVRQVISQRQGGNILE